MSPDGDPGEACPILSSLGTRLTSVAAFPDIKDWRSCLWKSLRVVSKGDLGPDVTDEEVEPRWEKLDPCSCLDVGSSVSGSPGYESCPMAKGEATEGPFWRTNELELLLICSGLWVFPAIVYLFPEGASLFYTTLSWSLPSWMLSAC